MVTAAPAAAAPAAEAPEARAPAPRLLHLVVDSGAIIATADSRLHAAAEHFWTVAEVLAEVRDARARAALERLPFMLGVRTPSDEAIAAGA